MVYKLFLDSDIVIDFFSDRKPFANSSSKLFDLNEKGIIKLYLSAVSINNIYYILRKFLGHSKTIDVIETLVDITEIIGTNKQDIVQALQNNFSDFEDSIQYSTALQVEDLDAIVTRNIKDYKKSKIAVMTPAHFLKSRKFN